MPSARRASIAARSSLRADVVEERRARRDVEPDAPDGDEHAWSETSAPSVQ
jgi:hypothetical protein